MNTCKYHLKEAFLESLRIHGNVARAARKIGVTPRLIYYWKQNDVNFCKQVELAAEKGRSQ